MATKRTYGPIKDQLQSLLDEMNRGEWAEQGEMCLIFRGKEPDILTIISATEDGIDKEHTLFNRMATAALDYRLMRVN